MKDRGSNPYVHEAPRLFDNEIECNDLVYMPGKKVDADRQAIERSIELAFEYVPGMAPLRQSYRLLSTSMENHEGVYEHEREKAVRLAKDFAQNIKKKKVREELEKIIEKLS